MPTVVFRQEDGTAAKAVQAEAGASLMLAAVLNYVDGILAECGGSASCGTCHVYVDEDRLGLLPPLDELEDATLDGTAKDRRPNSRLSCQITVTEALDGLSVTVAREG